MRLSNELIRTAASIVTILGAFSGTIVYIVRLDNRVTQLGLQINTLKDSLEIVSRLTEISKNPSVVVNPIQQECIELVQQANSGIRNNGMGVEVGKNVSQTAIELIDKLGCKSTMH